MSRARTPHLVLTEFPLTAAGNLPLQCSRCGSVHWLLRTDRPASAARTCDECQARHPVAEGEMFFESHRAGVGVWVWVGVQDTLRTEQPPRSSRLPAVSLVARAGLFQRSLHMFVCYEGAVYDCT